MVIQAPDFLYNDDQPPDLEYTCSLYNTWRTRKNGRYLEEDIKMIMSLKFVPKGPINNIPALLQIMPLRRKGDKPLSEAMMVELTDAPSHIYWRAYLVTFPLVTIHGTKSR